MSLFQFLLLAFIAVPLVEIYLLIQVGGLIGAWPTVFLVVATAVAGAGLFRVQGWAALGRVQQTMQRGEMPALELLEGVILLFGGALLLTPGFVTDALGFLCLIPAFRRWLVTTLIRRGVLHVVRPTAGPGSADGRVIDGEYRREDDRD